VEERRLIPSLQESSADPNSVVPLPQRHWQELTQRRAAAAGPSTAPDPSPPQMAMTAAKREAGEEVEAEPGREGKRRRTSFVPGLTTALLRQLISPDAHVWEAPIIASRAVLIRGREIGPTSSGPVVGWVYQVSDVEGQYEVGIGESDARGELVGSCPCARNGRGETWCKHVYAIGLLHIDEEAEVRHCGRTLTFTPYCCWN
jgi:hypothetical protein